MKVIQTRYGGHFFRSRLEARWAKFFDVLGVKFNYEPEGFEFPGGTRYLPDFYLPETDTYIEVKPSNFVLERNITPAIYFAGKMGDWHDNKTPGKCWRPFNAMAEMSIDGYGYRSDQFESITPGHVEDRIFLGRKIIYTGPWKGTADNHCYMHGITTCGAVAEEEILKRSLAGIDEADVVFALLNDESAIGTFAEIGYAHAKGKRIVVGSVEQHTEEGHQPWRVNSYFNSQMWFPASMATNVIHGESVDDVLASFKEIIDGIFPVTKQKEAIALQEFRKARKSYAIVAGDPMDAFGYGDADFNITATTSCGKFVNSIRGSALFEKAAISAREARFEFKDAA
jgi:nucleoside 2-deoxyribosyltransferase